MLPCCPACARFVDDTNVYRVTIHKTFEGNLVGGAGCCSQRLGSVPASAQAPCCV